MRLEHYLELKAAIIERGFSDEIDWATNLRLCSDVNTFADETIWVILNAGMKMQVARVIQQRILPLLARNESASGGFGHKKKCEAIDYVWANKVELFREWRRAPDRIEHLESIPHIGPVTKFHLARNLGLDCCKPDRHLVRIATPETPAAMCRRLSEATGDRIGVVDCFIWRAANLGLV